MPAEQYNSPVFYDNLLLLAVIHISSVDLREMLRVHGASAVRRHRIVRRLEQVAAVPLKQE